MSSATLTDPITGYALPEKASHGVPGAGRGRTMHCTVLEGPLNCLSIDRTCSNVVLAGRNVFKVFSIADDEFREKANLRVGKNLNLNYSAADVAWNPIEDNWIASAATNGAVVIWDLHKISRSKQEFVFTDHKRTVNKVCFHGTEKQLLMSGSQDGSMKLFDLRQRNVVTTFKGLSESVRDVQFSPHLYFTFAAAIENGNVQIWDMRNPHRCERHVTAHNGPTFSIDWHPDDRNWIASAGRDKFIKVWDIGAPSGGKCKHTVQTIASVARIKWRPQRRYHIASCSLLVDFSINIWDVRRPYIPFAAFSEHKDVVTGIVWKHNDPQIFLSSSKDCTVYQHQFKDATRPVDRANPVSCDLSIEGGVAQSSHAKLNSKPAPRTATYKPPMKWKSRSESRSEQFTDVSSTLQEYRAVHSSLSMQPFIDCATNYKLCGASLEELCEHNAQVAMTVNKVQECQTWRMLKLLYTDNTPQGVQGKAEPTEATETERHQENRHNSAQDKKSVELENKDLPEASCQHVGDTSTGLSDEESDAQDMEDRALQMSQWRPTTNSDFFFGDGELDQGFEFDALSNLQNGQDWALPNEAFQPRHEILDRGVLPDPLAPPVEPRANSPDSGGESNSLHMPLLDETNIRKEILSVPPFTAPVWEFASLVCDMLHYYAVQGDVQMAASVLVVLGEKIRALIDEITQEQWLMSYIDLLGRFKLWSTANLVIKLSGHSAVGSLNLTSTTVHTGCGKCGKIFARSGWLCDRCKQPAINTCSICHLPVKGIFVWCQGCGHGGHLKHIQEWLSINAQCPAGCGHLCEYT